MRARRLARSVEAAIVDVAGEREGSPEAKTQAHWGETATVLVGETRDSKRVAGRAGQGAAGTGYLHRPADWFAECGVTTVVMKSKSVYWIPIFELLDNCGSEVFLVNARDAKHAPRPQDCDVAFDIAYIQPFPCLGIVVASQNIENRTPLRKRPRIIDDTGGRSTAHANARCKDALSQSDHC